MSLSFTGGEPSGNGYRVEVTETATKVTINLINGWPGSGSQSCTSIGIANQLTVTTEDPVLLKTITQDPV